MSSFFAIKLDGDRFVDGPLRQSEDPFDGPDHVRCKEIALYARRPHEGAIRSSSKDHADAPYIAGFRRNCRMMIAHVTVDQSQR